MRFYFVSAAVVALASSVLAQGPTDGFDQITSPLKDQNVVAGKPFDIVWLPGKYTNDSITVTIALLQGKTPETLAVGPSVAAGVPNKLGKFTWDVPADAGGFATYGFRITHDDDKTTKDVDESDIFQYSFPFHIASSTDSGSGTTTIHLGTGTAYTPTPTANSTILRTSTKNTTVATPTPSSNATIATTVRPTTTGPSTTGSAPAEQSTNAAFANAVSGSLVLIGGAFLAFAL